MQTQPLPSSPTAPGSSVTSTISQSFTFVETLEHRRFVEFSDACRRDRYIGLYYGPPGSGKTLSARHSSRVDEIVPIDRWNAEASDGKPIDTVFYTPEVVNSPARVQADIRRAREVLHNIATCAVRTEGRALLDELRLRDDAWRSEHSKDPAYRPFQVPPLAPTAIQLFEEYESKTKAIPDPTSLIVVDEADRLRINSLEQLRSIFDESGLGMVLIGMPGIEKRIARYPQLFSRIGFVHEFRSLNATEMQALLKQHWTSLGISVLTEAPRAEVVAAVIRHTGGNFRLLTRLLTQMERVVRINGLKELSPAVVDTARENLVIGQA